MPSNQQRKTVMTHNIAHAISALALFACGMLFIDAIPLLEEMSGAFCITALCSAALAVICMGWGVWCLIQAGR
jgi:hypothetical protein